MASVSLAGCITINDSFNDQAKKETPLANEDSQGVELDIETNAFARNEITVNGQNIPCPEMDSVLKKFEGESRPPFQWNKKDGMYSPLDMVADMCLKRTQGNQAEKSIVKPKPVI